MEKFNKPVKIPKIKPGTLEDVMYKITIQPFEVYSVEIYFAWGIAENGQWVLHILAACGPQIDGIDLDETFTKIGPYLWSYREYIWACLRDILQHSYQGKQGLDIEYRENRKPYNEKVKFVNLDG